LDSGPAPSHAPPTGAFAYDSSSRSSRSSSRSRSFVVCYASSKFSINIHKPTNKSNQTDSGCIISSSSIARADSWTACTGKKTTRSKSIWQSSSLFQSFEFCLSLAFVHFLEPINYKNVEYFM